MLLWIAFAVLTAIALAMVLKPLFARMERGAETGTELAIYRDQLKELDRDLRRGVIDASQADAARTEISRRVLRADEHATSTASREITQTPVAMTVLAAVVIVALGGYLTLGSPDLPGQPRAQRVAEPGGNRDLQALLVQVEAQLEKNPEDARGWQVLAPAYMRVRRYSDAATAFGKAVDLVSNPGADLLSAWGEAIVFSNSGLVTAEAKSVFIRALASEPSYPKAKFYSGVAASQDGRNGEALKIWKELLKSNPQDAPWRDSVLSQIKQLEGVDTPAPGPDKEAIEAARDMSPQDRQAMVESMVARLSTRLEENGKDLSGWLRLVRARMVLKQKDAAIKALQDARTNLTGDAASLAKLEVLATQIGLE
jgi:cytochrome c-type biogenesis protein CcmH